MKAFDLTAAGRLVPARLSADASAINLRTYAVLAQDKTLCLVLINKEHGPSRSDAELTLVPSKGYARAEVMLLTAPGNDVEAKSGTTLGGAVINDDGSWTGAWTPLAAPSAKGGFGLKLPAATAAIVKLRQN